MKNFLYFSVVIGFLIFKPVFASDQEEDMPPQTVVVYGHEFSLLGHEEEALDLYAQMDLSPFDTAVGPTMEDLQYIDQNAGRLAGQYTKGFIEHHLGYVGRWITTTTGFFARLAGKETATELVIDTVRQPFKIEGEYPENPAQFVGLKLQKGVRLLPYGNTVATAAQVIAAQHGKRTLTEVILTEDK